MVPIALSRPDSGDAAAVEVTSAAEGAAAANATAALTAGSLVRAWDLLRGHRRQIFSRLGHHCLRRDRHVLRCFCVDGRIDVGLGRCSDGLGEVARRRLDLGLLVAVCRRRRWIGGHVVVIGGFCVGLAGRFGICLLGGVLLGIVGVVGGRRRRGVGGWLLLLLRIRLFLSGFRRLRRRRPAGVRARPSVCGRDAGPGQHCGRHASGHYDRAQPQQEPVNHGVSCPRSGKRYREEHAHKLVYTNCPWCHTRPVRADRHWLGHRPSADDRSAYAQVGWPWCRHGAVAVSRRAMASSDPLPTQGDMHAGVPAELVAAGFEGPEEIGRGGFGVVYRCSQPELDRTVAVKVLTSDLEPDNLERFVREQVAMGKLSGHPHIVTIFQVGTTTTGRPYIVMQYHPHGSLEAKIHDNGPVGWADALHIGVKVAGALETAHRRETLHRDVKPANILLTEYGEPQLTDFGIARIIGGFETADGAVMGSPAYTAPEVLLGQPPDVTSDVYSLASTLFCAGTGHAVFERRKGEQMVAQFLRITKHPMPSLRDSGLPTDVCAVIEQAMSRNVADRPGDRGGFRGAVARCAADAWLAGGRHARAHTGADDPVQPNAVARHAIECISGADADAADSGHPVPATGVDEGVGRPRAADRRPTSRTGQEAHGDPRPNRLREEHACRPVGEAADRRRRRGGMADRRPRRQQRRLVPVPSDRGHPRGDARAGDRARRGVGGARRRGRALRPDLVDQRDPSERARA